MSHRVSKGWSPPVEIAIGHDRHGDQIPCWNPVLFQPKKGGLKLFFKMGTTIAGWKGYEQTSTDNGITWGPSSALPRGFLGPIKDKPIQLSSGRIISGSSEEKGGWRIHFEYSDDEGSTWTRTKTIEAPIGVGAIQPTLLQSANGKVISLGRTDSGKIFYTDSADDGVTWSPLILLDMDNPNSGIDAVTLKSGRFLLVYNNALTKRSPLNIATSIDGRHWEPVLTLERGPGEFSYPAVIQTRDGNVHITYTWNRTHIKHVVLDPKRLDLEKRS
jgi:predicted neuraminidase